jgi:hypothetical protein
MSGCRYVETFRTDVLEHVRCLAAHNHDVAGTRLELLIAGQEDPGPAPEY